MPNRRHSGRSARFSLLLVATLFASVLVLVMSLPAPEGTAQGQPPTLTPTGSPPTSTPTQTATPQLTPVPLPPCEAGWRIVPAPSLGTYRDVAAISDNDVWIVGDDGAIHWDGASWSHVPTAGKTRLISVSAVGSDDVWATDGGNVIRWDGASWSVDYDIPVKPENGGYSDLEAIAADDVWLVGAHRPSAQYRSSGYTTHWDGEDWTSYPGSGSGTWGSWIESVSGIPGGHVWATGFWLGPLLLRWTGDAWNTGYADYNTVLSLPDIEVIAPDDVWAVGNFHGDGSPRSAIIHYDGSAWSGVSSPDVGTLNAVSAVAPDDAWAVGERGTIHWDGSVWSEVPAPPRSLVAVDTVGGGDAWALGAEVVLHYSSDPFWDVPPSNPFYSYVRCLACAGVIGGYADTSFRPNERITRGQVAKSISNAANFSEDIPSDRQTFADVPPDSPFWQYIERVYEHEAISGYPCGAVGETCPGIYYRPGAYLTRGQLAKIATHVAGYDDTPTGQTFNDVPPDSPFYTFIERAAAHNVISGYVCGGSNPDTGAAEPCPGAYFRPGSNVTRGQTAKIVANSLLPGCEQSNGARGPKK